MADWLADPANAERCATFPADPERVSGPGVYAWHGDDVANAIVRAALDCSVLPLYVDQAGADSRRTRRASGATLKSSITRHHLRGTTQASTFRRSLGAVLWSELDLRCERPRVLDADSNARLTAWMLEHLSVATIPIDDRCCLGMIGADIVNLLDPVCNLATYRPKTVGRERLRRLRKRHFSLASADAERIDRLLKLRDFAAGQVAGSEFLRRRVLQEERKVVEEWAGEAG